MAGLSRFRVSVSCLPAAARDLVCDTVIRRMPPNMPIRGTTATANNRVIADLP